jgi:ABC-type multidrug transport system fused ATPase/permease subunit
LQARKVAFKLVKPIYIEYILIVKQFAILELFKTVGVVLNKNFYFTGTLRENLTRKIKID